jgi:hypothetical protein
MEIKITTADELNKLLDTLALEIVDANHVAFGVQLVY